MEHSDDDDDCCTAGSLSVPPSMFSPMAWEVDREEIDEKSLYALRLVGIHLLDMSDANKDRLIALLREIVGIR